jgi:uncharacterized protein
MSDGKGASSDPSMDDILSSIRKIISDDEARAQAGGKGAGPEGAAPPPAAKETGPPSTGSVGTSPRDDVLLLTDLIEEPQAGAAAPRPAPIPIPLPRIDPVRAGEMPQPSIEPAPDRPLVESTVAGATSTAFQRLSQVVQDNLLQSTVPDAGPALGTGGKTIEDLVKEMLRPMLKDWLDKNLPGIVERFVEREIVRLTRR